MTKNDDAARGERARTILGDPLVTGAFAELERRCVEEWRQSAARDSEARERAWTMLKLLDQLRQHFESLVENGRMASERVAQLDRERRLPFFR